MESKSLKKLRADLVYYGSNYSTLAQYAMHNCIIDDNTHQPAEPDVLQTELISKLDRNQFDEDCWAVAVQEELYEHYFALFGVTGNHSQAEIPPPSHEDPFPDDPFPDDLYSPRKIAEALNNNANIGGPYNAEKLIANGVRYGSLRGLINTIPDKVLQFGLNGDNPLYQLREVNPGNLPGNHRLSDCVEIYFWGVPRAGKTSILASLLSHAHRTGRLIWSDNYKENPDGEEYHAALAQIMRDDLAWIPKGTPDGESQYMMLNNPYDSKKRIALFDVAGEIVRSVCLPELEGAWGAFGNYFNDSNPKFHFFVYDVSNDFMDPIVKKYQSVILGYLGRFFQETNAFNRRTSLGFAIIAAKSDILTPDESQREQECSEILNRKCKAFMDSLNAKAIKFGIIRGKEQIPIMPYSIGDVYLTDVCMQDNERVYPERLLNYIEKDILGMK